MKKKIALGVVFAFVLWFLYDWYWAHLEDDHQGGK